MYRYFAHHVIVGVRPNPIVVAFAPASPPDVNSASLNNWTPFAPASPPDVNSASLNNWTPFAPASPPDVRQGYALPGDSLITPGLGPWFGLRPNY
jgi:hypothetical protein